jgi:hypothetical protein
MEINKKPFQPALEKRPSNNQNIIKKEQEGANGMATQVLGALH